VARQNLIAYVSPAEVVAALQWDPEDHLHDDSYGDIDEDERNDGKSGDRRTRPACRRGPPRGLPHPGSAVASSA